MEKKIMDNNDNQDKGSTEVIDEDSDGFQTVANKNKNKKKKKGKGDFNIVLSPDDKLGGLAVRNYDTKDSVDCVTSIDLVNMQQIGCLFTWSSPIVCSNHSWLSSNLNGIAEFVAPGCISDHTISVVSLLNSRDTRQKPFKFPNMWATSGRFLEIVRENWRFSGHGTTQFRLKEKLKNLKQPLKKLNKRHFSHISSRAANAKQKLDILQDDMLRTRNIPQGYKECKRQAELLFEAERSFIVQKAKLTYLQQGVVTADPMEIAELFVAHYKSLLGQKVHRHHIDKETLLDGPLISPDKWDSMTMKVSCEEIKAVVFDIDNEKSPGPDGFGSFFFKNSWDIIKEDVIGATSEFFSAGILLKKWNHAIIALIPKSNEASSVNDYRPISCCTVFYKVIAKILSNRLAAVVGHLVDGAQAAFIRGHSIVDNIHLAQELLRKYARKRISPRCILKVDVQKAYDTVDWSFLEKALVASIFRQYLCAGSWSVSQQPLIRLQSMVITTVISRVNGD
ncbi:uncharacterized protein [Primulina eburnea]|uniref:uncharacterized protein n=1 Tax=Primulina eburnea TaxID=1245227 RepID=UPI003C6CA84C